jgi:hypothetical protein
MSFREGDAQARGTADAVARCSYGKLLAILVARERDVAAAEDALSKAFASALADWQLNGCPSNPEAWRLTVARRKIIDIARGRRRDAIAAAQLQVMAEGVDAAATDAEKLRSVFASSDIVVGNCLTAVPLTCSTRSRTGLGIVCAAMRAPWWAERKQGTGTSRHLGPCRDIQDLSIRSTGRCVHTERIAARLHLISQHNDFKLQRQSRPELFLFTSARLNQEQVRSTQSIGHDLHHV